MGVRRDMQQLGSNLLRAAFVLTALVILFIVMNQKNEKSVVTGVVVKNELLTPPPAGPKSMVNSHLKVRLLHVHLSSGETVKVNMGFKYGPPVGETVSLSRLEGGLTNSVIYKVHQNAPNQ